MHYEVMLVEANQKDNCVEIVFAGNIENWL